MKVLRFKSSNNNFPTEPSITATVLSSPNEINDNKVMLYNENYLEPQITAQDTNETDKNKYMQEYLKKHIGRMVSVDFIIGTDCTLNKVGKLSEVGTDYIVLILPENDEELIADFYSIKFVHVLS